MSAFLLAIFLRVYWLGIIILVLEFLKEWWSGKVPPFDIEVVGFLKRKRSDDLKGFVLPQKEYEYAGRDDAIGKIERQSLKNLGVFGSGGSGKSVLLSWFAWTYSLAGVKVFCFNYHKFEKYKGDFENLDFEYVDMSKHLPDLFNPKYKEFLIRAFSVVFVSVINKTGLMASMLEDIFREILDVKECLNWNDFAENAKKVEKNSSGLTHDVAGVVALKVKSLNVGAVSELKIQFDKSYLLDFAYLPNPLVQNLLSEFYANLIYHKAEQASISGKPHSVMLAVDECARLLRYGDISIIADLLRNARKHMRVAIASQNFTDVLRGLRHFQHFQFKTHNSEDIREIGDIEPLHMETVRQLTGHEFSWINSEDENEKGGEGQIISIYQLNTERLDVFREQHPQKYDGEDRGRVQTGSDIEKDVIPQQDGKSVQDVKQNIGFDSAVVKKQILDLLEKNAPQGKYESEIFSSLGISRADSRRGNAHSLLQRMVKSGEIRRYQYVGIKETKMVYYIGNEKGRESPIHVRGIDDIKKVCQIVNEKILSEYVSNHGWDVEISSCFLDFKTGLAHDIKDDVRKLQDKEHFKKPTTFACGNYEVKKYYENVLSVVDDIEGRYFVCCLPELASLIERMRNG